MRSHFNANVPTRMPTTQIGRVLKELASEETEQDPAGEDDVFDPEVSGGVLNGSKERENEPQPAQVERPAPRAAEETGATRVLAESQRTEPAAHTAAPRPVDPLVEKPRERTRLASGHERVAALRQRLEMAAQPPAAADPKRTAATVREVVDELRARLEVSIEERAQLVESLEETRGALSRAEAELERERKARLSAESLAADRQRIADDAVAEAEALATERDQVLAELAEQRRLDDEQTSLLVDIEASMAAREAERASTARELAELRDELDLRALEVADLESRLQSEAASRAKIEARLREMEGEVARLEEARAALEAIEAMVSRRS